MNEIEQILYDVSTPGKKVKMQWRSEIAQHFLDCCGFTDEEAELFKIIARGKSQVQGSFLMEEIFGKEIPGGQYSETKVQRRIRSIKNKIALQIKAEIEAQKCADK